MIDIESITSQVKHNCNISDAKYWGFYSPCGLLLRMRDLYRIENAMNPWDEIDHKTVGGWIDRRESLWQGLVNRKFRNIEINGRRFKPFDVKGINSLTLKHNLLYAAGYGNMIKPVFMFSELSERLQMNSYSVYISGRELARDLATSPAMIQGKTIIARFQTMSLFYWSKFEEMRAQKCSGALYEAFSSYGITGEISDNSSSEKFRKLFLRLINQELETYIHHEIGEASQRRLLGKWWKQLVIKTPYSRAEILLRNVKDVLSDTCTSGLLAYIIKNKKYASLSFYVALLTGFRKMFMTDLVNAYKEFLNTNDWGLIERARGQVYRNVRSQVKNLKEIFDSGRITQKKIEKVLMP